MKTILAVLLTISAILNVMFWFNPGLFSSGCTVTPGFEAPTSVTNENAQRYATNYRNSLPLGENITGGIITRSAFDQLMCTNLCNGIAYTFARMDGNNPPGVFVLFSGVNVDYNEATHTITRVNKIGTPYFMAPVRNWCPPNCNPW